MDVAAADREAFVGFEPSERPRRHADLVVVAP